MFWALFLGLLAVWLGGATSQSPVSQPPSASVSPGNTVKLTCILDSVINVGSSRIYWLQQKPPSSPRFLLQFHTDSDKGQGSGVPSRFSGSKDASRNAGYLTISGVLDEDEAYYFCATWHTSAYLFGGGTQLTVTGRPTVSPSVQVFAPSREEVGGQNPYTVVCLVSEFYPPGFTLQWKDDKNQVIPSGAETTKATKQGDKYLASSYLRLSAPEYEKHSTFTCEVTHESKTIAKTVSKFGSC